MIYKKLAISITVLIILLLISIWTCAHIGATREISFGQVDGILLSAIKGEQGIETPVYTIVWDLRLPRILLAALIGAALSMAGAAFQGLLRNPLADPYIVGTSAGAAAGGVLAIVLNINGELLGISGVTILSFIGAVISMYGIYRLSNIGGKVPVETFLLAGVVVGSFLWAMVSFLLTIAGKSLQEVVFWLMGSTQYASWNSVFMLFIYVAIGFIGLIFLAHPLNLLTLGDESAEHLGVDASKIKLSTIAVSSLITAAAVSVSGLIGFVGLMVPHVVRMIVGADHRILVPISALSGALFLMWVDTAARSVMAPSEIPVGILTAIIGAPFFLYLLRKRKRIA